MSNNSQKPETKLEHTLVRRQFQVRMWDTWEAPSLIVLLGDSNRGTNERAELRKLFNLHWQDFDIHVRLIEECLASGKAIDQRINRKAGVKTVYELSRVPEGIQIVLYVVALEAGVDNPIRDEAGNIAKLVFERVLPESCLEEFFLKVNAFLLGMECYRLAQWAKRKGDAKTFKQMNNSLSCFYDVLSETDRDGLTATVAEVAKIGNEKPAKKQAKKKGKAKGEKIAVAAKAETTEDSIEDYARKLAQAATGIDPGPGIVEENIDEAPATEAAPTPAPKVEEKKKEKKQKPAPIKLGSPESAAQLAELAASLPATDGSNGQS